jgi:BMFP domain-containing protein YqiC
MGKYWNAATILATIRTGTGVSFWPFNELQTFYKMDCRIMTRTAQDARCPYASRRRPISRRTALKGAGVALALPLLETMTAPFARAATANTPQPRRFFAINQNLGVLPDLFFPADGGRDYTPSHYLQLLQSHRDDFTVMSGVSHPGVDGSHTSDICFLTAAPHPGSSTFRNSISLDQFIAEQIGTQTRYPSLTLAVNTRTRSLSYTGTGVAIPPEDSASEVFKQLFLQGTAKQIEAQVRQLDTGRSILDAVADHARDLQRKSGARDRERLDQYFSSVRDLESRLTASRSWEQKPKPIVAEQAPIDPTDPAQYLDKVEIMYNLARLAFETDSTRVITLMLDSVSTPALAVPGMTITDGYHNLSHHGRSEEKCAQLKALDEAHMQLLVKLFTSLKAVREGDESLMERTMTYFGSNLGDANKHVTTNVPVIFAGGGFKHGQHLVFDTEKNYPLANLFVSILQRLDLPVDRFASSTGTMRGLELVG